MADDPYREPALYDLEYAHQTDDIAFYVGVSRRSRGPVLELGCGNGRITVPIARHGVEVHGVDVSEAMLTALNRRLRAESDAVRLRVRVSRGDFREIDAQGRYALVIWPFNAMHHCESAADVRAVLERARAALRPGGAIYMDCYLPDYSLYSRAPDGRYEERTFKDPRDGHPLVSWESGRWDPDTRVHHVIYVYQRVDGTEDRVELALRMFERVELEAIIASAGLTITWQSSDFHGGAMTARSLKWVIQLVPTQP